MRALLLLLMTISGSAVALPIPAIISAENQAEMASPMSGIIGTIANKEGETFVKGDLLIAFKCDKQQAELDKEKAILDKKQIIYDGYKRLKNLKAISDIQLMEAKSETLEAQALWKLAAHKVDDCKLIAPFNGQITKLYAHEYEHIEIGKPLVDIVSLEELEIKIIAPSSWLKWIKPGLGFQVAIKETDQKYPAEVLRYNHHVDPVSRTFSVYAKFSNKPKDITPGMSGQALFDEAE